MANLTVTIAGVALKNPVITASGCCGFGHEFDDFYPLSALGGIALKGLTLQKRAGNAPHRVAEAASGMINSVGLQNPGVDAFLKDEMPRLANAGTAIIANIAGSTTEDYCQMAQRLSDSAVDMLELNISCPNVKSGGIGFGTSCQAVEDIVRAVRPFAKKPLMVKLSPNVTDIAEIAKAAQAAGADAISLINTITAMRINLATRRPVLHNNIGGLSGPAVFPVAVRMVWQVANAVTIPVVGLGGISTWQDALEMMMAGARAVQVGAALFANPLCPLEITDGLNTWLDAEGIKDINDIVGCVQPW